MLTLLEQSVSTRKVKHFHTHAWRSSNITSNTLTETFWIIKTPFRRVTFLEYLQLKLLMGLSNSLEQRCLYDAPGVLENDLYIDALRAWMTDVPEKLLWERLQVLQKLLGMNIWSKNLYYTLEGVVAYEIMEVQKSIRKVEKYSGYVRNSSSVGSKRMNSISRQEPESFEWNNDVEIDFYGFLTVGEFYSGAPGDVLFTLMMDKSPKR